MAGSRRVQSARSSSTRLALKSAITSASASVVRLLNWQVTHHAAVKSTKTGRPLASAACTRSADQGCQPSASMTPEVPIPWLGAAPAAAGAVPTCSAGHAQASVTSNSRPEVPSQSARVMGLLAGSPQAQAAKATASSTPSKPATASTPTC